MCAWVLVFKSTSLPPTSEISLRNWDFTLHCRKDKSSMIHCLVFTRWLDSAYHRQLQKLQGQREREAIIPQMNFFLRVVCMSRYEVQSSSLQVFLNITDVNDGHWNRIFPGIGEIDMDFRVRGPWIFSNCWVRFLECPAWSGRLILLVAAFLTSATPPTFSMFLSALILC